MQLEVEQKYRLASFADVTAQLTSLGCRFEKTLSQADLYFAHPARDFRATDEALRLRRSGDEVCITYKGPKLDTTTKTRREIELPIANGEQGYEAYRELLTVLGFREVREVCKERLPGVLAWEGEMVHVALDTVPELGTFLELELLATPAEVPLAQARLASLAEALNLTQPERRGYLSMLLAEAVGVGGEWEKGR